MPHTRRDVIKTLGLGAGSIALYSIFGPTFTEKPNQSKTSSVAGKGERKAIVLDLGGGMIKAGFAGEDKPVAVFPAVVGRHCNNALFSEAKNEEVCVGYKALAGNGYLSLSYPAEQDVESGWADMQILLEHAVTNKLRVDPKDYDLIVTDSPFNTNRGREKTAQTCFESFKPRSFNISTTAVLTAYASGRATALVVSCGENTTDIVPVYEGQCLSQAAMRLHIAGKGLDAHLEGMLNKRGYSFDALDKHFIIKDIKESMCYVSSGQEGSASLSRRQSYELPDGKKVVLSHEKSRCPEALFQPKLAGVNQEGIHKLIYRSLMKCETAIREELLSNVVLEGGTSLFQGFAERLQREVEHIVPRGIPVNVVAPEDRTISAWKGAGNLAKLSSFDAISVSQKEYKQHGPRMVRKKCASKPKFHMSYV